jgi:hypothetical protein
MNVTQRCGLIALSIATVLGAMPASAAYLYWSKFPVKTQSEATCMQFANDVATRNGLQGVRRNSLEVAGTRAGVYVSITCVARSPQAAFAVVMAMGDNQQNTVTVRDLVSGKLQGIVKFDENP